LLAFEGRFGHFGRVGRQFGKDLRTERHANLQGSQRCWLRPHTVPQPLSFRWPCPSLTG
jgi:hypothetical protein